MNINHVNNSKSNPTFGAIKTLTPQALLKQVTQKREFPKFKYNKAEDKMLLQLEDLAKRYKQTLSLDDKLS